jgi:hypothetical protein
MSKLTIHLMPYDEIEGLDSKERIRKLLKLVLGDKIILLQGRLRAEEEARLIEDTMVMIGHIKGFKGIELAVISPTKSKNIFDDFKKGVAKALFGERDSMTVIGPASIVKEIKKDPSKIELFLKKSK